MEEFNKEPEKPDLWDKLIELDNIQKQGPTLRVVSDAMRSLLACVAMLIGAVVLYNHEPGFWLTKTMAIIVGFCATLYTFLAAMQCCFIGCFALLDLVGYVLHPNLFKKHRDFIVLSLVGLSLFMVAGLVLFVVVNVTRALEH